MVFENFLRDNGVSEEDLGELIKERHDVEIENTGCNPDMEGMIKYLLDKRSYLFVDFSAKDNKREIAEHFGLEYEEWRELMKEDRTLSEHVARYETDEARYEDYIALAHDAFINGTFSDAISYLEQAGAEESSERAFHDLSKRLSEEDQERLVNIIDSRSPSMR
nr:hypothetical protein [Methylomarinum sp. Ch1-1]MDP4523334.1 hypothetical protein [Methylomarinum sp. Ch1-1]